MPSDRLTPLLRDGARATKVTRKLTVFDPDLVATRFTFSDQNPFPLGSVVSLCTWYRRHLTLCLDLRAQWQGVTSLPTLYLVELEVKMRHVAFLNQLFKTNPTQPELAFYLIYREVTPDPNECELVEVGGYLHEQCFLTNTTTHLYKCPLSNSVYLVQSSGSDCNDIAFTDVCPSDPGFYQACGHAGCAGYKELGGTPLLCGTYICNDYGYNRAGDYWETHNHCKDGKCKSTNLNMVGCSNVVNTTCDGKCDAYMCIDESYCNGVQYGVWCDTRYGDINFVMTTTITPVLIQNMGASISTRGSCVMDILTAMMEVMKPVKILPKFHASEDFTLRTGKRTLTDVSCIRRFHSPDGQKNVSLPIPLEWVMDGEVDCLDGKDEDEKSWVKCGTDYYTRYQENGTECEEVLLCPLEKNYIGLNNLCDRVNTCSFEEKLCNAARQTDVDVTNLIDTFVTSQDQHFVQHCFPIGAADLERQLGNCNTVEHTAGFVKTVLNVQKPVLVSIPQTKVDCSHLFGVNYVYAACNNICLNAECPLKNIPGDTCINKLDSVVRALVDTAIPSTTTLFKTANDPGFYDNKIFPCDNKRCVSYRDVCNLKDDCGDGSDERNCFQRIL
eukprot:sb/3463101/